MPSIHENPSRWYEEEAIAKGITREQAIKENDVDFASLQAYGLALAAGETLNAYSQNKVNELVARISLRRSCLHRLAMKPEGR